MEGVKKKKILTKKHTSEAKKKASKKKKTKEFLKISYSKYQRSRNEMKDIPSRVMHSAL